MDNYKIDVTGDDIFNKGYGIIVVYNNSVVYGYKLPSDLQSKIRLNFSTNGYGFVNPKILKPKIYSAIVVLILEKITSENMHDGKNFTIELCNDFDGHASNILSWLKQNLIGLIFENLTADNYSFVRFPKKSLIQKSALKVYNNDWEGINKLSLDPVKLHNLISKPKFKKEKW